MKRSISKYGADDQTTHRLLQECGNSLQRHIERIVQPVTDEAFHVYIKHNDDNEKDDGMDKDESGEGTESMIDEEEEYDEEDLLDPEAMQKVQELRQHIRAQAASVQQVRQEVLEQAVAVGQRQIHLWLGESNNDSGQESSIVAKLDTKVPQEQLEEMHESLAKLSAALRDIQKDIPDKLRSLQETVAVIESNLSKEEEGTFSQTERAILSRGEDVAMLSKDEVTPEQRLASFLADRV